MPVKERVKMWAREREREEGEQLRRMTRVVGKTTIVRIFKHEGIKCIAVVYDEG